jgi:hypothetical protein
MQLTDIDDGAIPLRVNKLIYLACWSQVEDQAWKPVYRGTWAIVDGNVINVLDSFEMRADV